MKRSLVFVPVLLCWLGIASGTAQQNDPASVLRVTCLPARPLALIAAEEQHFFAKHGVEVEADVAANSDALRSSLAEGTCDIAHAAVDNAVALAVQSGLDIVVLLGGEGSTNELIVQPRFSSIGELRKQTLIVDSPTTAYAIQLKKILLRNGLHEGSDYQLKAIGATPLRLAALREHQEYGGSILPPPASIMAKHEGFVSLGSTNQWLGPYQSIGGFARQKWANANRKGTIQYLSAFIEGQRWLLDPANKSAVVALLTREYKLSQELAKEAYDQWIVAPSGLEADARLDVAAFRTVLKLREEIAPIQKGAPLALEKYYDPSFYDAAIRNLKTTN